MFGGGGVAGVAASQHVSKQNWYAAFLDAEEVQY